MFFTKILGVAAILQLFLFSVPVATPAGAQTAPAIPPPISSQEFYRQLNEEGQKTAPRLGLPRPQVEGPLPLPPVTPYDNSAPHNHGKRPPGPQTNEEKRFSYWGYRHKELHARGIIDELLERTKGKNCCNGIESGECRLAKVNVRERMAFVDGEWCPMHSDTKVEQLETMRDITDGNEEVAVVCASKSEGRKMCMGVTTYCIGIKPAKI